MTRVKSRKKVGTRGHAVMELAFFAPWIFFLFTGAVDIGFYEVALIETQNAARVACEWTSKDSTKASDSTTACTYARKELQSMHNVRSLSSCGASPLVVTATAVTGVDGSAASQVSVTYTSDMLVPIPWLMRQLTVTRTVQMRLRTT